MKAKQEFIINKIKEACPELMDLSFGCVILFQEAIGYDISEERIVNVRHHYHGNATYDITWENSIASNILKSDFNEVIGHPPQLNHLLKTFKNIVESELLYVFRVCAEGFILWKEIGKPIVKVEYKLSKSVLENLEDPILVDFLADVMGYTEQYGK